MTKKKRCDHTLTFFFLEIGGGRLVAQHSTEFACGESKRKSHEREV